ncbi:histidine kinase dimerization/phospho-acceptor domain-containing protein [Paenibacillus chartarius]|uniref:histidine kinase n=1 Tax=Paenibacillus chartarius TaxID=747481 RepID=A0ABV6DPG6_9BACL
MKPALRSIRDWPLALKIWGVFASITLGIFTLLALFLPWTLKGFFTQQIYDILIDSQASVHLQLSGEAVLPPNTELRVSTAIPDEADTIRISVPFEPPEGPVVRHLLLQDSGQTPEPADPRMSASLPAPFLEAMEQDARTQQGAVQKYSRQIADKTIFYVVRRDVVEGKPNFIVSYSWGNYRNDLVYTMYGRLMLLMVGLLLFSWLPCLALAKYLTRPLVQMERHVGRMSERDWHEPIAMERGDEIGRLAKAMETMRRRLIKQDKAQQTFLQHISHELKTPVMVIRSYAQSMLDGLLPKGTLQASVEVIMKESDRLEKRIRDLLYLNKLSYVSAKEKRLEPVELKRLIDDVAERLLLRRPEVSWAVSAEPYELAGDGEQWRVALENVLDNQLRYARSRIEVELIRPERADGLPTLRIWNDGPPLDEKAAAGLFEPFYTGPDGQFGLGLTIVQRIAAYHGMSVWAGNEADGAAFYIGPARKAG